MIETIACWIIGVGLAFDLFGCIGLVRLPDVYNRAQAATKCVTLGTCMILVGVALAAVGSGNWPMAVKALICASFILLTSPVGAHAICRGAYLSGVPLWEGSVEDAFEPRARTIRTEETQEGPAPDAETETA
ncbi:MAG: monovalent cation/H(+) antiporter subunit G [Planctomycetota bacterium]